MSDLADYIARRDEALRTLDLEWAQEMLPLSDGAALLIALHKARYDCVNIAPELRHQSGAWLRNRGFGAMGGRPLLPEGELPAGPEELQ